MKNFNDLPIKSKLIIIILAITVLTTVLCTSFYVYFELKTFKKEMIRNLTVLAKAIGTTNRATLIFNDKISARKHLSSLKHEPQLIFAALYYPNGEIFVDFSSDKAIPFKPPTSLKEGQYTFVDRIEIITSIFHKGEEVGKIYLHAHLQEFESKVKNSILFAVMILILVLFLVLGVTIKLQNIISKPILSLANTAKEISETSNYSIRVDPQSMDEIGTLFSGFNDMLSQIEQRENELSINRKHLEEKIIEVTSVGKELKKSEGSIRTILNNAFDAIITMDSNGIIQTWNRRATGIFGWASSEVIGKKMVDLIISTPYRDEHTKRITRFLETGESKILNKQIEVLGLHQDGHTFPMEIAISPTKWENNYIFTGIIKDITERKQAEEALMRSREQLRNLSNKLQSVREEEKTIMAREIHDHLGQALTMLKFEITWIENELTKNDTSVINRIQSLKEQIENIINDVRKIASELRPQMLDILGLSATLKWLTNKFQKHTGIQCELIIEPEKIIINPEWSTPLFRIYQEALTNVARHAKANEVQSSLRKQNNNLVLEIKDNGIGMDEKLIDNTQSLGLIGIRERILVLGGTLHLKSHEGKGTTLTVTIPLD